jgi:hypothetical protein
MKLLLILLCLALATLPPHGMAQESGPKDMEADLLLLKKTIEEKLTPNERTASRDIRLWLPNTLALSHVGAYRDIAGKRNIAINVGMTLRLLELSKAIFLENKLIHDERYWLGYARYLAYSDQFGGQFITADEFATRYLGSSFEVELNKLSPADFQSQQNIYANAMAFVVAHEIAHHVLGHLDDPDFSGTARRRREEAADSWAASATYNAGFMPVASVFTMLLLNEAYERSEKVGANSSHPAPISRAIALSKSTVELLERGANGEISSPTVNKDMARSLLSRSRRLHEQVEKHAAAQRALDNPMALLEAADGGNRHAQLRIGELYSTGENSAFPLNYKASRDWYQKAASNTSVFDYMDQVDADARVGWMYAFMPKKVQSDIPAACFHLKRSASTAYSIGKVAYEKLVKDGRCVR